MSDRIAVMSHGHVEQVGTPEEIYDSPETPFVAGFIGSANLLPARVETIHGDVATVRLAGDRILDVPICAENHSFRAGEDAMVMIRPERVRVSTTRPEGESALPATVVELIFQGPVVRCVLRDASGDEILAHLASDRRVARPGIGEQGWASWDRDSARLLPAKSAE